MLKSILLLADPIIEIAAAADGSKTAKFSMTAYSGGVMYPAGYSRGVILDLEGMAFPKDSIPINYGHDDQQGVGHADSWSTNDGQLKVAGSISRDTEAAREIVSSAKKSFPWKSSIGASVLESESIEAGKTATVNGRKIEGPMQIVRKSSLAHIAFVERGADPGADASIKAARAAQLENENMDVEEIKAAAAKAERERISAIRKSCGGIAGAETIEAKAIEECWTPEKTDSEVLAKFRNDRAGLTKRAPSAIIGGADDLGGADEVNFLQAALMVHSGAEALAVKNFGEPCVERVRANRPRHLLDIFAMAAHMKGLHFHNTSELIASYSTTSLPVALGQSMEKRLIQAYETTPNTAVRVGKPIDLPNFRKGAVLRIGASGNLDKVGPHGELKHGHADEMVYYSQNESYGKTIILSRQDIINDDAGVLSEIPFQLGQKAAAKLGDVFWLMVMANANSYFHANNKNLDTGAGSALGTPSIAKAIASFRNRVDADGMPINMQPNALVVGPTNEFAARQAVQSPLLQQYVSSGNPTVGKGNPFQTDKADMLPGGVLCEPRIENAKFTNYSTTLWFMFADPSMSSFLISYLSGSRVPTIITVPTSEELQLGSLAWQCIFDFGCGQGDPAAAYEAAGA